MKSSKKALMMLNSIIIILLIVSVGLILYMIFFPVIQDLSASSYDAACKIQLGLASQGQKSLLTACHSYRIEFDEKSAVKYDMFISDEEVYDYTYASVLNSLKKIDSNRFKDLEVINKEKGGISEEIVYYIIAEEMKKCHDIYNVPELDVGKNINLLSPSCIQSNFCQPCSLIHFNEDFKMSNEGISNFKGFLKTIPYSKESIKTYYELFYENYFNDVVSYESQTVYADESSYNSFFEDQTKNIFGDEQIKIYQDNSYLIEYVYRPNLIKEKLMGIDKFTTKKINPYLIDLIPMDEESTFCDYYLTLMPGNEDKCVLI